MSRLMDPPRSDIISQLGLDTHNQNGNIAKDDARQEARQLEFVDLMIQAKRRKLIQSLSSRIDQVAEDRLLTASYINDIRLSNAASNIISIATKISEQNARLQQQTHSPGNGIPPAKRLFSTSAVLKESSPPVTSQSTSRLSTNPPVSRPLSQSQSKDAHPTRPAVKLRLPDSNPTSNPRSLPKRPTEMPYEELRKLPDFKRLSWSWTGLIVGVPVLITTSWVMWKDYNRRMMERKLGLDGSLSKPAGRS